MLTWFSCHVRFLHVLGLYCYSCCFVFLSSRKRGGFSLCWWQSHLQYIAISGVFKAAAPEAQRGIISPAEWYLALNWMFLMFLDCFSHVFVSSFQDCHIPANRWFEVLVFGHSVLEPACEESWMSSLHMWSCFSSIGVPSVRPFVHPIKG